MRPIGVLLIAATMAIGVVPATSRAKCDVNRDSLEDILIFNPAFGRVQTWNGAAVVQSGFFGIGPGGYGFFWPICGDVDGDGASDVVWNGYGATRIDLMDGVTPKSRVFLGDGGGYFDVRFVADLDGDGRAELIEDTYTDIRITKLNASATMIDSQQYIGGGGDAFKLAAIGDLDGNGLGDLVWSGVKVGITRIDMNPLGDSERFFIAGERGLVAGVGDLDGDGNDDLVVNEARRIRISLMDGGTVLQTGFLDNGRGEFPALELADLNGDARLDLVCALPYAPNWQLTDGYYRPHAGPYLPRLRLDLMNGVASVESALFATPASGQFRFARAVDISGDGKADLLFDGPTTLRFDRMNGTSSTGSFYVPSGGASFGYTKP